MTRQLAGEVEQEPETDLSLTPITLRLPNKPLLMIMPTLLLTRTRIGLTKPSTPNLTA